MKKGIFGLCAAIVICSAGTALAIDRDTMLVTPRPDGRNDHATYRQVDVRTTIGLHLWTTTSGWLTPCPDVSCPTTNGEYLKEGTVADAVDGKYGLTTFAKVK